MATPQDVAAAIVALSSEGTGSIDGEIIGVDAGEFIFGSWGSGGRVASE